HSLDQDGIIERGVRIAPIVHELIGPMAINFNQPVIATGQSGINDFANDPTVRGILDTLNTAPRVFTAKVPRALCDAATTRNALRRNIRGIIKMSDVWIPTRDGSYVCADVFRPAQPGRCPVGMSKGGY